MSKYSSKKRIHIYSALEVANMCGVVNQTAINWIRNGHLKAFNTPGGQYRVYKDDLIDFIKDRGMRIPDTLNGSPGEEADWSSLIIVDDDMGLNNGIKAYVEKNMPDMHVLQSFDGFDAGALLVEKKPGFVILDLALPGVDGQEICKRIKTDPAFGKPFIIAITALDDPSLESTMYELGADCFFHKPLAMAQIIEAITAIAEAN